MMMKGPTKLLAQLNEDGIRVSSLKSTFILIASSITHFVS